MKHASVSSNLAALIAADSKENAVVATEVIDMEALMAAHPILPAPARHSLVSGEVVCVTKGGYYINIGRKGDSFVPDKENGEAVELTLGERYTFYVASDGDETGAVELSYVRVKRWEDVKKLRDSGVTTPAKVLDVAKSRGGQACGLHVVIGGLRGFIPRSEVTVHARLESLKGTEIPVQVLEADPLKGRNGELVCSHSKAVEKQQDEVLATLQKGAVVPGVVTKIIMDKADRNRSSDAPRSELGALVDIGGVTGLVHRTEVSDDRSTKPSEVLTAGQEVAVEIIDIDLERRSVKLSFKRVQQAIFLGGLSEGDVIEGLVKRVDANIGYFVRLGGCIDGLLHNRELVQTKGQRESLTPGQTISVKVLKVTEEPHSGRTRIALSRKGL